MRIKNIDKHEKILDAAIKVFARKGFYQSKVSEIAKEAGVADGTIYLYFKNKDDVLISVFETKVQELISKCRRALVEHDDAPSRLRQIVTTHLAELGAHPEMAAVLQVEIRQSSRFMREYKKDDLRQYLNLIGDVIAQGQREGCFRTDLTVSLGKRFVFGVLDEVVTTWLFSGGRYDLSSQIEPIMGLFLKGISTEESVEQEVPIRPGLSIANKSPD